MFLCSRTYSSDSQTEPGDVNFIPPTQGNPTWSATNYRKMSGVAPHLRPEYIKTLVSCLYMFLVTWITAIIMVYVHDRVPDKVIKIIILEIFQKLLTSY